MKDPHMKEFDLHPNLRSFAHNHNKQIWTFTRPTASKDHRQCFGLINLNIVRFFDLHITFSRYFGTIELDIA